MKNRCHPELVEGWQRREEDAHIYDYVVYMLRCSDGSFYTGITNNLEVRFWQHQTGSTSTCYTYRKRPIELVYASHFSNVWQAIAWEKQIKRWSRKKKIALVEGSYELLPQLSDRKRNTIAMVRQAHHDNVLRAISLF